MADVAQIARTILAGFDRHYRLFRATSAAAKERWEKSDWEGIRLASQVRIGMYDQRVREGVDAVEKSLGGVAIEEAHWPEIKRAFIGLLHEHMQPECAETFFNSVSRRLLDKRYHRNEYIFSRPAMSTEHLEGTEPTYRCYYPETLDLRGVLREALTGFGLHCDFADLNGDVERMGLEVDALFPPGWERRPNMQVHVLRSLFFRSKAAYAIGRIVNGSLVTPFVIPLLKDEHGRVYVDAILLDKKNIGRLFSLGRNYFFADMEVPSAYVDFLQSILPTKTKAELYTVVGLQKQGKTLFFRDLTHHLRHSTDTFVFAEGTKGMVMVVFALQSFPYVFKVIRDWFPPPKDTDRGRVEERYQFVKLHDRVGRMTDTLEFAHVAFPAARMDPALVADLEKLAPSAIERDGSALVVHHLYIERRLVPLDLYLRHATEEQQRSAIAEYGRALKELAGANIFAGDLLIKNFGVTRYGRIVFYDYDEICELTDCRFRSMPQPRDDEDEMRAEPWFSVEPGDIFPEQFPTFLFPDGPQRRMFLEMHGELATAAWWRAQQERLRAGDEEHVWPYPQEMRFVHRYPMSNRMLTERLSSPPSPGPVPMVPMRT